MHFNSLCSKSDCTACNTLPNLMLPANKCNVVRLVGADCSVIVNQESSGGVNGNKATPGK